MNGSEWQSYLRTQAHSDYPSSSACFCAAVAAAARAFYGSDALGTPHVKPAGSSVVEPGITPGQNLTLSWATWSDWAQACGQSRLQGGVHFQPAITEGQNLCGPIGKLVYDRFMTYVDGTASGMP